MANSKEAQADYARLFAQSLRQIIFNWVTLRPLLRKIFSFKVIFSTIIALSLFDLLDATMSFFGDDNSLYDKLDDATGLTFYRVYQLIWSILWVFLFFILFRYVSLARDKYSSDELRELKKSGVLTDSEYLIKNLEFELKSALRQIALLKDKGVLSKPEVDDFVRLTHRRYSELKRYQKLRQAKSDNVITDSEFKEKCKSISIETDAMDIEKLFESISEVRDKS